MVLEHIGRAVRNNAFVKICSRPLTPNERFADANPVFRRRRPQAANREGDASKSAVWMRGVLAQDLLDPGDRAADRLLGADPLSGEALDRLRPDTLPIDVQVSRVPR
jgi:hypothetical protein